MSAPSLDAPARERLRADLEAIPGVRQVALDADRSAVFVVCEQTDAVPTELTVRAVMTRHGLSAPDAPLQICYAPIPQPRRRVRFLSARVETPRVGRSIASVELEWDGQTYHQEAEGTGSPTMDLRLAALATLRTLEAVLHGQATFHLVGIKNVRAFDTDVIMVLLRMEERPDLSLVGASISVDNPFRSAALAVLNATNRVLGNYLNNLDA